MKKYRNVVLILLAILLLLGMPVGLILLESQREAASKDLILSIELNDMEGALAALKAGADPNARHDFDDAPLSFAARTERLFRRWLHPSRQPESMGQETALTLHLQFSKQDNTILVKALLDAGADPNLTGIDGWTPLLYATALGADHNRMRQDGVRLLLKYGANPNAKFTDGGTALHFAAGQGDVESVQLLIAHGADVNAQDSLLKETPLVKVLKYQLTDVAQILIDNHTNLNLRDVSGRTALDYARRGRLHQIETILRERGAKTGQELDTARR